MGTSHPTELHTKCVSVLFSVSIRGGERDADWFVGIMVVGFWLIIEYYV